MASLARGSWDDLSARLRRPPGEQAKQTTFANRLDRLIQNTLSIQNPSAEQQRGEPQGHTGMGVNADGFLSQNSLSANPK